MRSIKRKIGRAWAANGGRGVVRLAAAKTVNMVQSCSPPRIRGRWRDARFDRRLGVSTRKIVSLNSLHIDSENWNEGFRYQATSPDTFHSMMQSLSIRHEDFDFVDIGSGKGRALFLAAEYPFRAITGIEFSRQLHDICTKNISAFRAKTGRGSEIRAVCMDALEFPLPERPTVVYLYNPFSAQLFGKFLRRVSESLVARPRDLYIVYYNPVGARHADHSELFEQLAAGDEFCIYRHTGHAAMS